jgi:flagellar hook-associated protein 3 FlgL
MAILPTQLARVSNLLRTNSAQGQIALTQRKLLQVQNELTTGKRINVASDDPGDAAIVQQLQKSLEMRRSFLTNLNRAKNHLSEVDSTLGDLNDLIQRAQEIASANVGSDVPPEQRAGAAAVVESIYGEALTLANKQFEGVYLFAGDRSTDAPFVAGPGGVRFVGSENVLQNAFDESTDLPFMVNGADVFGALSSRVHGRTDLSPAMSAATPLSVLKGATANGVRPGLLSISNGTSTATIDLRGADNVGDVLTAINAAGLGGVTASIAPGGGRIVLNAGPGDNITVTDSAGGTVASDLGLLRAVGAGAGVALTGQSVAPAVTALTPLSSLRNGAGIDQAGGLRITSGGTTTTIDLSSAVTVEDLLNTINGSGARVLARINAPGTGIDVVNPTQGSSIGIGENGGTTAADLGVRSFAPGSLLSDFNGGKGVRVAAGADFRMTRSDGSTFDVDLAPAATTVQDVIDAINAASGGAGLTASLATIGNGIVLTDTAGGPGAPAVSALNFSNAAADLGLTASPSAGNVIAGADANTVASPGLFANLAKLRDALTANDSAGITAAAEGLSADYARSTRVRGETGARVQGLESRQNRLEEQDVATKSLLSTLSETDMTEAISRFQTLQTALQASMQTTAQVLHLSLLDFLG